MAYTEFTLWLLPSEPLGSELRSIINQLAARFDAVEFEPHVTVFCGPSTVIEAQDVLEVIANEYAPIELAAEGLDQTKRYTKTFFVQFQEAAILRKMSESAANNYKRPSNYILNPHLSLLYKSLPDAARRNLCETINVPKGTFLFDRVRIIETELPIEDHRPIERWQVIREAKLKGT
jgi:hypothetical protein